MIDSSKFPQVKDLKALKVGDNVYSEKYGLGSVIRFYGKEVVVSFSNFRLRFSLEEQELKEVPKVWQMKSSKRPKIIVNGKKTTIRHLKFQNKFKRDLAKALNS